MFALIVSRLRDAHVDLENLGIVLIGDPAQLLPICGCPLWGIQLTRCNGKDFTEDSYIGLAEFRHLFRLPKLEKLPYYNRYKRLEALKDPNELQRKQIAEFIASAFDGDYDAVYLSEVKRSNDGDPLSHEFITELLPCCRYGKATERHLLS